MRHPDQELPRRLRIDVGLVDIVRPDRRHRNQFGRRCGGDDHEDKQKRGASSAFAQQRRSSIEQDQAGANIGMGHAVGIGWENRVVLEGQSGETHCRRTKPRDRKPGETSHHVSGQSVDWRGGDRLVIVPVVLRTRFRSCQRFDDEEDSSLVTLRGKIAAVFVARHRVSFGGVNQEFPDFARRSSDIACRIRTERKGEYDSQNDHFVDIVGQDVG